MGKQGAKLSSYADAVAGMEEFGSALKGLLRETLKHHGVDVHTIDHRVKAERSARLKVDTSDGTYGGYEDLHDLLGLRITCYFAEEVERVAGIIDEEFRPDPNKSEDKKDKLGPKEFGYRSVHRVAWLGDERATLAEYARFKNLRFEVQIRTVLQHAWAEIEHDIGYKAETIPEPMRRRFSMLAGVLELVDYEFQSLRKELNTYEERADRAAESRSADKDMDLDVATLSSIIRKDSTIEGLDKALADIANVVLLDTFADNLTVEHRVRQLRQLRLRTIDDVRIAIYQWARHIHAFVALWLKRTDQDSETPLARAATRATAFPRGVGIFYLYFVISLETMRQGQEAELPDNLMAFNPGEMWERVIGEFGPPPHLSGS
ncbi:MULTISPECIES: GTP pyrophosphokinase family protein [unclassified Arthrobacter]|uniref:GTP pyrophosphokinase n=1 Tax=unclassified Arthrobacter TaxID=235627 RepID=UPI0015E30FB8|nr:MULTISPECIES: RelA/SpoT domain-containing protein [unclassified Arthrobacter]